MSDDEKLAHALRIAQDVLEATEFSWVYEDEDLLDAADGVDLDVAEQDARDVHDLIINNIKVVAK